MNLSSQCPHCQQAINGPADIELICPHCQGGVILSMPQAGVSSSPPAVMPKLGCAGTLFVMIIFSVGWALIGQWWGGDQPKPSSYHTLNSAPRSAIEPSLWDGSVSEAKRFVEGHVRDPRSVKYNSWKNVVSDGFHITSADITAANGFGGPTRETWLFTFNKQTGTLINVFVGNKMVFGTVP